MNDKIPIFPLPLVLLPGEKLPLHIFEEKYKKMIEYCLKNNKKFGIINSKNNDSLVIGCTASIEQLVGGENESREYDILVSGVERFIVKSYNTSESYKQAYVKTWNDIDDTINEDLLQEANVFLYEVLLKLGASSKIPQIDMPKSSFEIASMLDIDKRAKKILLKSQSENDRLIVLKRILKKAIIKIDYEDPARSVHPSYSQFEA
ncbi:LON peptidase substrate-binding domain-containing protein [Candidatus Marinimicrobia bacterium]|jgi:Lon protease-like protein|nr:LON peptidase substrate-binding domain-containing protein [Candidatus Neomarinimicrobiota bacterium]|tara:strand:- start:166 stop:780 length:615 start_codon:yes stop_codon:yes gene_type:complete